MSPTRPPLQAESAPLPTPPVRASASGRVPALGERFDKYQLLARLATGGMAELFVARLIGASGFRKNVVIKRILPHVTHDVNFTRMFLDEAITCAQINHPNVCQVFELCKTDDTHFLVLEHLEGATVGELVRRCMAAKRPVNIRLAAGILVQACDGLHAAHEQVDNDDKNVGLVHRDVSPGNLFITVDGIVKVLDFGIAKAAWMSRKTRTGTLLGKCEYMSPEQARGEGPIDRRSDVFSLGIIAWEMFCGKRLFRRESEYETLRAVLRAPIEHPRDLRAKIPEALDSVIMRALERDPDDRYRTASEFRHALSDALGELGGPTPMCEIGPIIRSSFAEDLRMQRSLIKEATRTTDSHGLPALRNAPRGTIPGSNTEPGSQADEDAERTDVQATLPSLSTTSSEEAGSMELTFRVIPKTPPRSAKLVPRQKRPTENMRSGAAARNRATVHAAGTIDTIEYPQLDYPQLKQDSTLAPPRIAPARHKGPQKFAKQQLLLLAVVAMLGAALVGTLATIYFGHAGEQRKQAAAAPSTIAPPKMKAVAAAKVAENATTTGVNPAGAAENEEAQAKPQATNKSGRAALVTSLAAKAKTGSITIRSSRPATIYLYPSKTIIGTTPLKDFALPAGKHKLKAQIGAGKGERKYFQITVKPGETVKRNFQHWKK